MITGAQSNITVSFVAANGLPEEGEVEVVFPPGFNLATIVDAKATLLNGLPFGGPIRVQNSDVPFASPLSQSASSLLATSPTSLSARIVREGVSEAELRRVKTRMKADWYNGLESFLGRADLLAQLQALWGDARVVSQVPVWIDGVTSAQIQRVAATYLTRANRSVIDRRPAPPAAPTPRAVRAAHRAAGGALGGCRRGTRGT
jgi:hypothetical protein